MDYERIFSSPALFSGWSPFHADSFLMLISVPLSSSLSVVMLFSLLGMLHLSALGAGLLLHLSRGFLHGAILLAGLCLGSQTSDTPTVLFFPMFVRFPVAPVFLHLLVGYPLSLPVMSFPAPFPVAIPPTGWYPSMKRGGAFIMLPA